MVFYHDIGSHSMNRYNCIFECTVVNISRIFCNHAPWFCGNPLPSVMIGLAPRMALSPGFRCKPCADPRRL